MEEEGVWRTIRGARVFIKKKDTNEYMNEKIRQGRSKTLSSEERKKQQFEIIKKENPMLDDYHVGIRSTNDIKTWREVLKLDDDSEGQFAWGDFTREDAEKAFEDNKITIYSSYDIKNGTFVSTSKIQAEEYAGGQGSKVYAKTVQLNDVAWINGDEGQYAKLK